MAIKNMFFNCHAYDCVRNLCESERPQILQGFGVTKHLSASVFKAAKDSGVQTIMRLSDYALLCPNSTALDGNGNVCLDFECFSKGGLRCIRTKCVKSSLLASFVGLCDTKGNKFLNLYKKYVDHWIAPSKFIRDIFIQRYNIPEDKITHLPIFYDSSHCDVISENDGYILYAGRIDKEKGIKTLLSAVETNTNNKVKIAGDGPLSDEIASIVKEKKLNVELLGFQDFNSLKNLIKKSMFLVVPSEWYENSPNIALEAFAYGKPVIGSRIGGIPELVRDNETGLTFESGNVDDLREKISYMINNPEKVIEMGKNARKFVEQELNAEKHYEKLMEIYQSVIML